jgi:hypothetical protein
LSASQGVINVLLKLFPANSCKKIRHFFGIFLDSFFVSGCMGIALFNNKGCIMNKAVSKTTGHKSVQILKVIMVRNLIAGSEQNGVSGPVLVMVGRNHVDGMVDLLRQRFGFREIFW